jgi:dihydropteroate synthase
MAYGISREQLCVDPGIGFTATREEDIALLTHTRELKPEGVAYLVGVSRKRVTGEDVPPAQRLAGSIAAQTIAQLGGADILRTHDVFATKQAVKLTNLCISAL